MTESEFIRALVNAWDCCGTCAGGVLAKRDRERRLRTIAYRWTPGDGGDHSVLLDPREIEIVMSGDDT